MKIVIIGNGIAGTTAAVNIAKQNKHSVVMISSESKYPYSRTALMYVYMGHLPLENTHLYPNDFWKEHNIVLMMDHVNSINTSGKFLILASGNVVNYDKLILATGSIPNKMNMEGGDLAGIQCLYSLSDLNKLENSKISNAVIVGGGLIGIELAEMLSSRGAKVTMLVREDSFWNAVLPKEESEMINRHILSHGIDLRLSTSLQTINGTKKVESVTTDKNETLQCDFIGITIGVSPNTQITINTDIEKNRGILVDEYLETNHKDIFAIGDCVEIRNPQEGRRAIESVWYTGKMMGELVCNNLESKLKTYTPGLWYNSAKFFDIEYQVYGYVPNKTEKNIKSIFWQDQSQKKSIRIVYEELSTKVIGFNLMGIRYRQEVCEKFIKDGFTIEEVLKQLALANFDPEFYNSYEQNLIDKYNIANNSTINLASKKKLSLVQNFLKKMNRHATT
jgi:NAD(P)H-nitrite reductase large subunit